METLFDWSKKRILEARVERLEQALDIARKELAALAVKGVYNEKN